MTTQTITKPQPKQPKTKKTPSPKKDVSKNTTFTKEDFYTALDKVISAPIPPEQTSKKQPEKVK